MSCAKIDPSLHQAAKAALDQSAAAVESRFLFHESADFRFATAHVCESAQCPNRWECWSQGTATMMIAGDRCTRACGFCAVTTAKPFALEEDEPQRVAEAVRRMKLKHVVITAVARDDLKDGGANHFARTIDAIREMDSLDCDRSAGARFSCPGLVHPDRARRRAGHLQSQHGDGRASDADGAFAREIPDFAAGFEARERAFAKSGDEERRHAWTGRDRIGVISNDG